MLKNGTVAFIAIMLLILSGCGFNHHHGNQTVMTFNTEEMVQVGKTTKQDLLEKLGPPQNMQKNQFGVKDSTIQTPPRLKAAETWSYWSNNVEGTAVVMPFVAHTSTKSSMKILTFYFDENGIVIDYAVSQTGQ